MPDFGSLLKIYHQMNLKKIDPIEKGKNGKQINPPSEFYLNLKQKIKL